MKRPITTHTHNLRKICIDTFHWHMSDKRQKLLVTVSLWILYSTTRTLLYIKSSQNKYYWVKFLTLFPVISFPKNKDRKVVENLYLVQRKCWDSLLPPYLRCYIFDLSCTWRPIIMRGDRIRTQHVMWDPVSSSYSWRYPILIYINTLSYFICQLWKDSLHAPWAKNSKQIEKNL